MTHSPAFRISCWIPILSATTAVVALAMSAIAEPPAPEAVGEAIKGTSDQLPAKVRLKQVIAKLVAAEGAKTPGEAAKPASVDPIATVSDSQLNGLGLFAYASYLESKAPNQADSFAIHAMDLLRKYRDKKYGPEIWHGELTRGYLNCVAITNAKGTLICSGVLISREVVLTAAHCDCAGLDVDDLRVVLGADVSDPDEDPIEVRAVQDYYVSRKWAKPPCTSPGVSKGDLRLLRLSTKVPAKFSPATLATTAQIDALAQVRVVGFGLDHHGAVGRKNHAVVAIASKQCSKDDASSCGCTIDQDFVASDPTGSDTCDGDSGGPAYDPESGDAIVTGITSKRVHGDGPNCGPGGIYVRVDGDRRSWICEVLDKVWQVPNPLACPDE